MKIVFSDITYTDECKLTARVYREDVGEDILYFTLPAGTELDDELIALAFSTLCGKRYNEIEMSLGVGGACKKLIEKFCSAELVCRSGEEVIRASGVNAVLSFSGGFDSLGAKALLGDKAALISLDFGGKFSRERIFFERFKTSIVETNLVDLRLNRNHWSFMAIGAILLKRSLSIRTVSFGSIMAGSIPRLLEDSKGFSENTLPHFTYLGVDQYNPLAGVTEIGAMRIALLSNPGLIKDSLSSLANPKEGKFFRKSMALNAFCKSNGFYELEVEVPKPKAWYSWGKSYADDLSALYVLKIMGRKPVEDSYTDGIPSEVVSKVESLSLDFFNKYNPEAYLGLSVEKASHLYLVFSELGLLPFTRRDYNELEVVDSLIRG